MVLQIDSIEQWFHFYLNYFWLNGIYGAGFDIKPGLLGQLLLQIAWRNIRRFIQVKEIFYCTKYNTISIC